LNKRLQEQEQRIRVQKRREKKAQRSKSTRPTRLRVWREENKNKILYRDYNYVLPVPERFSFIEEPATVSYYLDYLQSLCEPKKRILVDMKSVKSLTNCALLLLSSKLIGDEDFRNGATILVRPPRNAACRAIWDSNRTPKSRRARRKRARQPQPLYRNRILGRRPAVHKKVEPQIAETLILEAMRYIHGTPCDNPASYRVLTECMANSFKHADPDTEAAENWWISSYVHPTAQQKTRCFAFVDNGVGIFESIKLRGVRQKLKHSIGLLSNAEILQLLLTRKLGSRTGLSYRGKGLPAIYRELLERKRIENLIIISNDTQANLADGKYIRLPYSFKGTFVYWEVSLSSPL
jgi:hypothetical protein